MRRALPLTIAAAVLALLAVPVPSQAQQTLFSKGTFSEGVPMGGPYVPPGSLYDNEQSNNITSLASQDSTTTFTVRSADDFTIVDSACASGTSAVTGIRIQMVQSDTAGQAFAIDLYDDNGSGTAPTPANAITPIQTFPETSKTVLGPFGIGTSIWEVSFDTPGLVLNNNTVYWISGFGANGALNSAGFNNFFATSNGATGTTANGVIIAPGFGITTWSDAGTAAGSGPLAFSFAIDGSCAATGGGGNGFDITVPTLSPLGIGVLAGVLALLSVVAIARRRNNG